MVILIITGLLVRTINVHLQKISLYDEFTHRTSDFIRTISFNDNSLFRFEKNEQEKREEQIIEINHKEIKLLKELNYFYLKYLKTDNSEIDSIIKLLDNANIIQKELHYTRSQFVISDTLLNRNYYNVFRTENKFINLISTLDNQIVIKENQNWKYFSDAVHSVIILLILSIFVSVLIFYKRNQEKLKNLENAKKATELQFVQSIIDSIPSPFFYKEAENLTFLGCNKAFEVYMGKSKEEIIGKNSYDINPGDLAQNYIDNDRIVLLNDRSIEFETKVIDNKNKERYAKVFKKRFLDLKGNVAGIISVIHDVTEQKKKEKEISDLNKLYENLASNIPNTNIYVVDRELIIRFAIGSDMTDRGLTPDYYLNRSVKKLDPNGDYDIQYYTDLAFKGNKVVFELFANEIYFLVTCIPIKFKDNEAEEILVIANNITEQKEWQYEIEKFTEDMAEAKVSEEENSRNLSIMLIEMEELKKQADDANESKSIFLANVSHEIRTPMNAILGFTEILINRVSDKADLEYLQTIHKSGKTLLAIINDILDLSKIESGRLDFSKENVDLRIVISDIKRIFSKQLSDKSLSFISEIPDDFPEMINTDDIRLRQILTNLVGNAIKFTEEGYIKVCLDYQKGASGYDKLKIDIVDTGIGIPENERERIFKAFIQQSQQNARKYGGTGLGLTITKKLITGLGGSIKLNANQPNGSIFTILFENIKAIESDYKTELKKEDRIILKKFSSANMLVITDSDESRELIKGYLSIGVNPEKSEIYSTESINLFVAENCECAEDIIKNHPPDIVFSDIDGREHDCYDSVLNLKNTLNTSTPIIAVTTSLSGMNREYLSLFDNILHKPFSYNDLMISLIKYLKFTEETMDISVNDSVNSSTAEIENEETLIPYTNEMIEFLESDLFALWEKASKVYVSGRIEEFAQSVISAANKYGVKTLLIYGNKLLEELSHFKIVNVKKELASFPELINNIKMSKGR